MNNSAMLDLQVNNPNLDRVNIYHYTPFIGFRGTLYIIENITNVKL